MGQGVNGRGPEDAEFGNAIRMRRERLGLTQAELSEACGIPRASIAKVELGQMHLSITQMWSVANSLNLDLKSLIPAHHQS